MPFWTASHFLRFAFACLLGAAASPLFAQTVSEDAPTYVGSQNCVSCHADQAEAWQGSHHALAWTQPSPETVVADFGDTKFFHDGVMTRFLIDEGEYRISVTEADGTEKEYTVHSVAGVEPLQQYLIETEPGKIQSFDVVWDVDQERWYHLYPDQNLPPNDGLHWTGPYKNWNARCAECHATGFEKNYDPESRSYASVQAEIGVGCEACHGPASRHVAWAEDKHLGKSPAPIAGYGFSMDFATAGIEATIQQCATCHARREAFGNGNPVPGTTFDQAYNLALLRPGLYEPDGQILDEVYVYGSFLQSKMYDRGVGCMDCHDAHSVERIAEDNSLCTQCHSTAGNNRFPTLTLKEYDTPEHHFHEVGSEGAQCKSCHMIERAYMGIDWRRDHSFRIPRPDISIATGAPNACSDCHEEEDFEWAADRIEEWYPNSENRGPHFGLTLAQGRIDPAAASGDLVKLATDTDQPDIVRATAVWLLEQTGDSGVADEVTPLLEDPNPLVRAASVGAQKMAQTGERVLRATPLLTDPSRQVRIAAARAMMGAPVAHLPSGMARDLGNAFRDWQAALSNSLDFPETHMVIGGSALTMRNFDAAAGAFGRVVDLDPQRIDAWVMLTRLTAATQGRDATLDVLEDALEANPQNEMLLQMREEARQSEP